MIDDLGAAAPPARCPTRSESDNMTGMLEDHTESQQLISEVVS